jgi:hypothetical protein
MADAANAAGKLKRRPLGGALRCGVFHRIDPEV